MYTREHFDENRVDWESPKVLSLILQVVNVQGQKVVRGKYFQMNTVYLAMISIDLVREDVPVTLFKTFELSDVQSILWQAT